MKKKLLILSLFAISFSFAQLTNIPDANFENYLETHDANGNSVLLGASNSMGNGVANDHNVFTSHISLVSSLGIMSLGISDLTGIEDFISLSVLACANNQITSLDVSQNTALSMFGCNDNQLTSLNVKNGNNTNILFLNTTNNPNLVCIEVDDVAYSNANWSGYVDATSSFSVNCSVAATTSVPDANFEAYLETHDTNGNLVSIGDVTSMGNGIANDTYVFTSRLISVTTLNVSNKNISDLTGIEDFNALTNLNCKNNLLTNLNIQGNLSLTNLNCSDNSLTAFSIVANTALTHFNCSFNNMSLLYLGTNINLVSLICDNNTLYDLNVTQNTALTSLSCSNNSFNNGLDVTQNTNLTQLSCSNNNLNSLDVTQNVNLTTVTCISNNLTSLDVSNNTALYYFNFGFNNISSINTSQNVNLNTLICNNNNLAVIDLSQNTNLVTLDCGQNNLGFIGLNFNISNNTLLTYLSCSNNALTVLDVSNNTNLVTVNCTNNSLVNLDFSLQNNLTNLHCESNQLVSLNIKNGNNTNILNSDFNATNNPNLTCIDVDDVAYSTTNWTQIDTGVSFSLNCSSNGETFVPDDNFENYLETHNANGNIVAIGDVTSMGNGIANDNYVTTSHIDTVTNLNVSSKSITELTGIEDFTALTYLYCYNNQLTNLDVTQNTTLLSLQVSNNQLLSLDVTQNILLNSLSVYNNPSLNTLNVTQNTALEVLNCRSCSLTNLDVTQNTVLTVLTCWNNPFNNGLDVTQNTALTVLSCGDNQLLSLDVTQNISLTSLNVFSNLLNTLDLTQNTALTTLYCSDNQLTDLSLAQNGSLINLDCWNNQLTSLNVKNGNNTNFTLFKATNNPNLTCIEVDDATYSTTNWTNIDSTTSFSENCSCTGSVTQFNSTGWSNGFPTPGSIAIINDMYQVGIEGNFEACSCEITQNGYLQIDSSTFIKINRNITNNGIIEVLNQGSFVQINNDATLTGNGTYTTKIQTTQLNETANFTYFSSPVQNQDLTVFSSWARMNRLWRFDELTQDWTLADQNDIMLPAVGYAIQGDLDTGQYPLIGYANFNGVFNNGIYSYPLTYNSGGIDDDNALVGNPYPSAIDAALLLSANTNANAFYFWTHKSIILPDGSAYAGDDYAIWNSSGGIASASGSSAPTGYIASGQGFFVEASGTGNLVFNNSMRVTGNNTDFRRPANINRDRIWLNLSNDDGFFNQILINFSENGTPNFDNKLDAVRIASGNAISFYSNGLNDENFAIQAVPNLSTNTIIPLGYKVNTTTIPNLTISIDHSEFISDTNIYLKDNLLNVIHDLKLTDYQFSAEQGQFNNRFELVFNRSILVIKDKLANSEKIILSNSTENTINVKTKNGSVIKSIKAFDILGKIMINQKPNKNNFIINTNIKQGTVLFVVSKLSNGQIINTKFIKT